VSSSAVSYLVWGLLGAAAAALWWVSARRSDTVARPARVVERLATGPMARVVFVLGIMWAGWHLFAR
jgi:type IV secretory pathway VirB2 component (pilin)